MLRNYVTTAIRVMLKNRLFTGINIVGLAISLSAFILVSLYILDEVGFEKWITDHERIYRVEATFISPGRAPRRTASIMGPAREALDSEFGGEIEASSRYYAFQQSITLGDRLFNEPFVYVDPDFFDVFDLDFLAGSAETALRDVRSVVITESMARKYFGDEPAMGRTLTVDGNLDFRVTAIIKDLPDKTHLQNTANFIALFERDRWAVFPFIAERWRATGAYTYVKLRPEVSPEAMDARFPDFLDRYVTLPPDHPYLGMKGSEHLLMHLKAIDDIRLYSDALGELSPPNAAARTNTIGLVLAYAGVAILILVIASVNFINLSTAKATTRAREIGMRKVLGAVRKQLMLQFLAESVLTALAALLLAMAMVEGLLPWFNAASGKEIIIAYTVSPVPYLLFAALMIVVGLISGLYPALVLSSYRPSQVIRSNRSSDAGSRRLRTILTVVQFAISIGLITATMIISRQTSFANNIELGYDPEDILVIRLASIDQQAQAAFLKDAVARIPGVRTVGYSDSVPGDGYGSSTLVYRNDEGGQVELALNMATPGPGFFEVYGVKPVAGRLFSEEFGADRWVDPDLGPSGEMPSIILNESAARAVGFDNPADAVGQVAENVTNALNQDMRIVGVVPDLRWASVREEVTSMVYFSRRDFTFAISVKMEPGASGAVLAEIDSLWLQTFPGVPVFRQFVSDNLARQYDEERRASGLFTQLTVLALLVSSLGLYGLAAFAAERRTREIALRKVLGAGIIDILRLLLVQFSAPVLIANLIAWPVAWYFMSGWLTGFAYRIDMSASPFLLAGGAALGIAWATVAAHAVKVARAKPIHALRYE